MTYVDDQGVTRRERSRPPPAPPPPRPLNYRSPEEKRRANWFFGLSILGILALCGALFAVGMHFQPTTTGMERMVSINTEATRQLVYMTPDCKVWETPVAQGQAGRQYILVAEGERCTVSAER